VLWGFRHYRDLVVGCFSLIPIDVTFFKPQVVGAIVAYRALVELVALFALAIRYTAVIANFTGRTTDFAHLRVSFLRLGGVLVLRVNGISTVVHV